MGQYQESVESIGKAIEINLNEAAYYHNLCRSLEKLGRDEEAVQAARDASRLEPDDPTYHWSLGEALSELDRYEESEAEYREAIRLKPDYSYAHSDLSYALLELDRIDESHCRVPRGHTPGRKRSDSLSLSWQCSCQTGRHRWSTRSFRGRTAAAARVPACSSSSGTAERSGQDRRSTSSMWKRRRIWTTASHPSLHGRNLPNRTGFSIPSSNRREERTVNWTN